MFFYIEYFVYDFAVNSGLSYKLRPATFENIAHNLMLRSSGMNLAQVLLFFYFLLNNGKAIGPPKWNGTITTILISGAFNKYREWLGM